MFLIRCFAWLVSNCIFRFLIIDGFEKEVCVLRDNRRWLQRYTGGSGCPSRLFHHGKDVSKPLSARLPSRVFLGPDRALQLLAPAPCSPGGCVLTHAYGVVRAVCLRCAGNPLRRRPGATPSLPSRSDEHPSGTPIGFASDRRARTDRTPRRRSMRDSSDQAMPLLAEADGGARRRSA